ncbi:4-hydroxyphenylacetate 3-hydroxylase [Actinomadura craniellae]|uniref:4-hydroxyphenylacetate 3-hydroxylase n=1 Tax=Actinomadura craniellae TaxID=2231787 RepID=A0A365HB30_9ACTN|nr:4-hydroxyphenylacetate 3-hydroxylase N-terminal domain-containing protein [Actinomadura craniellae]RAY16354.1 4-hydroxyphenylacetate 3-hydroxylase [Actinomadura craniellae]
MLTGDQYLDSLRDGRRLFVNGHAVPDVTEEPLLRGGALAAARGYDQHYQPGDDAFGPYFFIPSSVEELRATQERQLHWDFPTISTSNGLLMVLTAASRMRGDFPQYAERALAYFEESKRRDIRLVQTITDAKGNRSLPPAKQDDPDLYLRIVDRSSDGIVIRGAKLHISSAAIAHELMVMPTKRMKPGEEDYSVAAAVPVNAPGVRVINASFAPRPDLDPDFFPYSSRHVMTEGLIVFDDVFVPNEQVFLAGELEHSATFAHSLGLWERLGSVGSYVRLADTLVGLAQLVAEANGLQRIGHIKDKIAEMITYATLIRAGFEAAMHHSTFTPEGWASPDEMFTNAAKYHAAAQFSLMVRHLHDIAGGSVLTAPSMADLRNPETGPDLRKYMRTMEGVDADYRMRLFHTIRDFTADAFGGWKHVTVIQAGGGLYAQKVVVSHHYDMDAARALALETAGITPDGQVLTSLAGGGR